MDARPPALQQLAPGLRRLIAGNPSPMTYWGTNTYIVGTGRVGVIDPGPADKAHMQAILDALAPDERISHIFVTHAHTDHSPLARPLARASGAPVYAFGDSQAGRSTVMQALSRAGLSGGGEGVDAEFRPDRSLKDGQRVAGRGWALTAHWTPGHMGNHICLEWEGMLFTGDHVMGWASSLVSPPDGDLTDFMASTRRLLRLNSTRFYPGHGAPVDDPQARLHWLLGHRLERERSILRALAGGPAGATELTAALYRDTAPALLPAARRNVFAHLVDLVQQSRVVPEGKLHQNARFRLPGQG